MFPPATLEKVVVSGGYYGSSNEVIDDLIVKDIEKILKNSPSVENIATSITKGSYSVSADIKPYNDKTLVINDIKSKLEQLNTEFPENMRKASVYAVENFFPLISISIFSEEEDYKKHVEVIKELKDEITQLDNIYQAEIVGKLDKSLRIYLDYEKVDAYGLDKLATLRAIGSLFSIFPVGKIESDTDQYLVSTKTNKLTKEYIENLSISVNGKNIQVGEVATVKYHYQKDALTTRTNGENSIIIMTKKTKDGDSIKLSSEIRNILKNYQEKYSHMEFQVLSDSSFWIKKRLNVISSNIIIGLILLFFGMWLFISLRVSLVVLVGIPVSLAFGIIGLDFFQSGLNTLSMIGVLLSLGLLVDEAIVVSENIHRHMMMGKDMQSACIDGTLEVLPALGIALATTMIAFSPLLFLSGGLGLFVKIIPLMVIILIASSFLESFIFLPAHYRMVYKNASSNVVSYREQVWEKIITQYKLLLEKMIQRRYLSIFSIVAVILVSSVLLIVNSRFVLFPEFDAMSVNISGKVNYNSTKFTSQEIKPLEEILLKNLDKESYSSIHTTVGMKTDGRGSHERNNNLFTITINLNPKIPDDFFNREINPFFQLFGQNVEENRVRLKTAKMIKADLHKWLQEYEKPMALDINIPQTGVVKSDIGFSFSSNDEEAVYKAITKLKKEMANIEGVSNIKDDMQYDDISLIIEPNDYATQLGFTQKSLIATLSKYLRSEEVSKISNKQNEFLELKLSVKEKNRFEKFENLQITVPEQNVQVALKDIVNIIYKKTLSSVRKEDLKKLFGISASLDKKVLTSREFYKKIAPHLDEVRADGIEVVIGGEAGKNKQVQNDITKSFIFAAFGILIVLSLFFNSIALSLFSLSVIPLSIFGVMIGHTMLGLPLTFSSLLGLVGLIGIIMNDTLIMLDFIKRSHNNEELVDMASKRLKPILLTSITTVLGLFTLMFFASGESLLMQPLAVSIGFGLVGATIINLLYVPVAYSMMTKRIAGA